MEGEAIEEFDSDDDLTEDQRHQFNGMLTKLITRFFL